MNVGVSPCFHCTILVPVYSVYTSCFHNTVVVPVTGYILPVCIMEVLLFISVWTCGFNLSWNVSLVRSWWESAHIQFNLRSVYYDMFYDMIRWDFVPTSPWGKFYPVPTVMLIVTMISIRTYLVRHTVSIGNRFLWLYINCFQSPWFWCIIRESIIFPLWLSKREGGGSVACF